MNVPLSATTIVFIILAIATIALATAVIRLEMRVRALTRGKNGASLEQMLVGVAASQRSLEEFRESVEEYLRNVERRLRRSIQGTHTLRFDPFEGCGRQSFASAFLDEDGNGLVLSTISGRERVSVFAKPLAAHRSDYELTEEEREAVSRAQETLKERRAKKYATRNEYNA